MTGPQRQMRPMHPISSVREAGSRKRRLPSGCQVWVVGDHVDAFIQDGYLSLSLSLSLSVSLSVHVCFCLLPSFFPKVVITELWQTYTCVQIFSVWCKGNFIQISNSRAVVSSVCSHLWSMIEAKCEKEFPMSCSELFG